VLNVDGSEDVYSGFKQREDIFITLAEATAFYVAVCQLINQCDLRGAGEDGVYIHLREERSLVIDLTAGDVLKLLSYFCSACPAVGFHDADDDVFSAVVAADTFTQHAEGFADTRCVTEKDLEAATLFFLDLRGGEPFFRPLARLLRVIHGMIISA